MVFYTELGKTDTEWAGKSYAEIQDLAATDGSVLIIPVGSIEQHGPHLPVATDTLLVDAVAHAGAELASPEVPVLVTPPVWSGFSPHHLSFGGTLSLNFENLRNVLEEIAMTGLENGFDAVLFLNGHGGNAALIDAAVSTVGQQTEAEVLATTYFQLATDEVMEIRESERGGMAHGGEFETSLMLHLRDDLVGSATEMAANPWDEHYEWSGQDLLEGGVLSVYRPFKDYSESGAIGEPSLANAEKGERIYDAIREEFSALLVAVHEHNTQ
ncbi:creatininase family protein [Halarchaeum nitratireducens]|uniref:Creatininase n=1 Tax=Halarchaeum nitratireducens TaxID=489913 RepID=A0A830GFN7_9EURY|nr:creatininase family protein [Halarchaeum nitratireducens]GGN24557.1 creatininase [Halarchaeum nitratireducens]